MVSTRPRDPRLSRPSPGPAAGWLLLAWLLATAVLWAGSWGAVHRVAHGPLAHGGPHVHAKGLAGHAPHTDHAAAPGVPTPGLLSAVDSHEPASAACRLLDQLACADGLLIAAPALVPPPLAVVAQADIPTGTALAPAGAYRARAPPPARTSAAARA